jgi:hypothetical protein
MNTQDEVKKVKNSLINRIIISRLEEVPFIIFLSFLITFVISRSYVYLTRTDIIKFLIDSIYINGIHVHHLNFGISILVIVGFISLYDIRPVVHRRLAMFYGIGLGLTFDEFALWLKLQDDYYASISYDAIIIIAVILLNIIYFPDFWKRRGKQVTKTLGFIKRTVGLK